MKATLSYLYSVYILSYSVCIWDPGYPRRFGDGSNLHVAMRLGADTGDLSRWWFDKGDDKITYSFCCDMPPITILINTDMSTSKWFFCYTPSLSVNICPPRLIYYYTRKRLNFYSVRESKAWPLTPIATLVVNNRTSTNKYIVSVNLLSICLDLSGSIGFSMMLLLAFLFDDLTLYFMKMCVSKSLKSWWA